MYIYTLDPGEREAPKAWMNARQMPGHLSDKNYRVDGMNNNSDGVYEIFDQGACRRGRSGLSGYEEDERGIRC